MIYYIYLFPQYFTNCTPAYRLVKIEAADCIVCQTCVEMKQNPQIIIIQINNQIYLIVLVTYFRIIWDYLFIKSHLFLLRHQGVEQKI